MQASARETASTSLKYTIADLNSALEEGRYATLHCGLNCCITSLRSLSDASFGICETYTDISEHGASFMSR